MATNWTLANIRTYLGDRNAKDASTRALRMYDRIANRAMLALHSAGDWDFDLQVRRLVIEALYDTGTVSITQDATALTGSGTAWTAAMVGRFFRFGGQYPTYEMTAYSGGTSVSVDTYRGATLSGEDYQLTHDRIALPARFRKFSPVLTDNVFEVSSRIDLPRLLYLRIHERLVDVPRYHAWEWKKDPSDATGDARAPYVWVYPSAEERQIYDLPMYLHPDPMSVVTDTPSIPEDLDGLYESFLTAFLEEWKHPKGNWAMMLAQAQEESRKILGHDTTNDDEGQVEYWVPESDWEKPVKRPIMGSGEPVYT